LSAPANRPEEAPSGDSPPSTMLKRIGWLALIWAVSVAALGVVSLIIRWWLK
jgi:hypothetical protein